MGHARGGSEASNKVAKGIVVVLAVAGSSSTTVNIQTVWRATLPKVQLHVARVRIADTTKLKMRPQVVDALLETIGHERLTCPNGDSRDRECDKCYQVRVRE